MDRSSWTRTLSQKTGKDTTDPVAPDPPQTDAIEDGEQDESASDSNTSDMQVEDTPPPEVTGKRKR